MARVLGVVELYWRGISIPATPESTKITLGGFKNTSVVHGRQVGRSVKFEASSIETKTVLAEGDLMLLLGQLAEGDLFAICDTGQVYAFRDAFLTEHITLTANKGGEITLKWAAGEWLEVAV